MGRRPKVDVVGFIADKIQGYVGHTAIISELLQNADDARATKVSFHFDPDHLIVRNNSQFSEDDWHNIDNIASHTKRDQEEKIGTFGTGFVSVYHITDRPEILSGEYHRVIDPQADEDTPDDIIAHIDYTEFRLPWRFTETAFSRKIQADIWTQERIEGFWKDAEGFIGTASIFLRHVRLISIYVAGDLILEVGSELIDTHKIGHFQRERWHRQITTGKETKVQEWLHYVGTNPTTEPDNCTIKDRKVALAFPLDGVTDGRLYNFLPTGIETGLPFHINGAFFPDNNRHGILHDTSTNIAKTEWNFSVIETIAHLFADALLDIRHQCSSPETFYQLWPMAEPGTGYQLAAICQQFMVRARTSPIVYSTRNQWVTPEQIWIPQSQNLRDLAHTHADLLPTSAAQISTFIKKHLGAKQLTLRNLIEMIQSHLGSNIELVDTHPMINDRDKLAKLYADLPNRSHSDFQWFRQQPVFLSERGILNPASALYSADKTRRELFENDRPLFVDIGFQAQLLKEYVDALDGIALVDWLLDWQQRNSGHAFFRNDQHLTDCLAIIDPQRQQVDQQKLSKLYMIRVEGREEWFSAAHEVYLARNSRDYELGINNLLLVDQQLRSVQLVRDVYTAAGIHELKPSHVVNLLRRGISEGSIQMDLPLAERLFGYLSVKNMKLNEADIATLRELPICYTANGRWVAASKQTDLSLKPELRIRGWEQIRSILDKLELDNYIHPGLQGYRVLGRLGISALDEATFNLRLVRQYYSSSNLKTVDRLRLLDYVRDTYDHETAEFQEVVSNEHLIYCHDGQYRRASEVYFASPLLDDVFSDGYHHPHQDYELPIADADDEDMRPYVRSEWYRFFADIGMREEPRPSDVIGRIDALVATRPQKANIKAIIRIIRYLDSLSAEDLEEYAGLVHRTWLPAGDDVWHAPSDIYQQKHIPLIGQQEPILKVLISSRLVQLLGIPEHPDADLVARHLLHSAEQKQPIEDGKVYAYLGKHWDEVSGQYRSRLKSEAIIWDSTNKCYWKPDLCFIGNEQGRYFGTYRHYREPDDGHIGQFYRHVGIHEDADPEQRLIFLRELAQAGASHPLSAEELGLLKANLAYIGERLDKHAKILSSCRQIHIVPDEERRLHRPGTQIVLDDQPGLRDKFANTDLKFIPKKFYVEQINRFWDAIEIPRLSVAKLQIVDIKGKREDRKRKRDFVQRIRYLRRVVYDKLDNTDLPFDLNKLTVYMCDRLQVCYTLLNIESVPLSEPVAFNHETDEFFCTGDASTVQLARQLIDVLHLHGVIDAPVIDSILSKHLAEIDAYLDECGFKALPDEYVHPDTPDQPMVGTGEAGEEDNDYAGDVPDSHHDMPDEQPDYRDDEFEGADLDETPADTPRHTSYMGGGASHTSHSPHYPNNLSELVGRFNVEQEFPEPPPPELINLEEEEISSVMDDVDFDGDDDWIPDDWSDLFDDAPDEYEPNIDRLFYRVNPAQVFADVQQIRRELPKPEDRRGVFQLICEAFPEDGAVLHLHDIRSAVRSRRPEIAEGTISSILSRARPCFEPLGDGYWSFNAKYIDAGYSNMNAAVSAYNRWGSRYGGRSTSSSSHPYGSTGERQNTRNRPPTNRDKQSHKRGQGETSQFNTARPDPSLRGDPIDLETFIEYVPHEFQETQLDVIYHTAQNTREQGHHPVSLYLFELLGKYGLDFSGAVQDLWGQVKMISILDEIEAMPLNDGRRWSLYLDALQESPNDAHLLNAIQSSVRQAAKTYGNQLKNGRDGDIETIARSVIDWLSGINPLWIAWQRDETEVLGLTARYLFDWLIEQEQVELAVELIAQCPAESSLLKNDTWSIDMNAYWSAIELIVEYLTNHGEHHNAQIMQIYGAFVSRRSKQRLVDVPDYEQLMLEVGITSDDIITVSSHEKLQRWLNLNLFQKIANLE